MKKRKLLRLGIIIILLGISLTLNIISMIIFLLIYKYSLKGMKERIENTLIKNFIKDDIDIMEVLKNDNK